MSKLGETTLRFDPILLAEARREPMYSDRAGVVRHNSEPNVHPSLTAGIPRRVHGLSDFIHTLGPRVKTLSAR